MSWNNETYLIGEKVKIEGEKKHGVITRIDVKRGVIYVLFKRMREEVYPYPEALENGFLKPETQTK
jgi:transposase